MLQSECAAYNEPNNKNLKKTIEIYKNIIANKVINEAIRDLKNTFNGFDLKKITQNNQFLPKDINPTDIHKPSSSCYPSIKEASLLSLNEDVPNKMNSSTKSASHKKQYKFFIQTSNLTLLSRKKSYISKKIINLSSTSKGKQPKILKYNESILMNGGLNLPEIGLYNIGNTCYFNTALQLIKFSFPFSYYLKLNKDNFSKPFSQPFSQLFLNLWTASSKSISPENVFYQLSRKSSSFKQGHQSDSYEALIQMLNIFHQENILSPQNGKLVFPLIDMPLSFTEDMIASPIYQIFNTENSVVYGLYSNIGMWSYKCCQCKKSKARYDLKLGIELGIENITNVESALENFLKKSLYKNYFCPDCRKYTDMNLQYYWLSCSPIIVFQMKRFFLYKGTYVKDNSSISLPHELNISQFVIGKKPLYPYCLVGVGNHSGSLGGGHYYAYGNNVFSHKWNSCNDDYCSITNLPRESKDAITLVYLRKDLTDPANFNTSQAIDKLDLLSRIN